MDKNPPPYCRTEKMHSARLQVPGPASLGLKGLLRTLHLARYKTVDRSCNSGPCANPSFHPSEIPLLALRTELPDRRTKICEFFVCGVCFRARGVVVGNRAAHPSHHWSHLVSSADFPSRTPTHSPRFCLLSAVFNQGCFGNIF